ncbi:MAG TPA: hypothetical protein VFW00_01635 [Rhodocyclaceae bacterium]|nr:hypothetical protein [Rhodocyclaceae bacterium]
MPCLLLLIDLPPGVPYEPDGLTALGAWHNEAGTESANLASLTTGAVVEQHGIIAEWECRPDGVLPRRAPRSRLMIQPLWERLPDSLAVAWPWTTGSNSANKNATVISPDFMRIVASNACTPLPGHTSPRLLAKALEPLRFLPGKLDPDLLWQVGYGESLAESTMLAEALSAHAIATALLLKGPTSLAAVRLRFTMPPNTPTRLSEFVALLHRRYNEICIGWRHYCVIRTRPINATASHDSLWGNTPDDSRYANATTFSRALAKQMGLSLRFDDNEVLPDSHWQAVQNRYQVPKLLRPDVAPVIIKITSEVQTALKVLELRRLAAA